jgi:hypothetical protein
MEVMSDEEEEKAPQSPAVSPIQVKRGRAASPTAGFVSPGLVTFKVAVFSLLAIPVCYALRYTELVNEPYYLVATSFVTLVAVLTVADRAIFYNMPFKQYDLFMVRPDRNGLGCVSPPARRSSFSSPFNASSPTDVLCNVRLYLRR